MTSIYSILPWGHPFRGIDRLVHCDPHRSITTLKCVTANEALSGPSGQQGAALPGPMILEGMGQSASLLHQLSYGRSKEGTVPVLGFLSSKADGAARAGDEITYTVRAVKMTETMGLFRAVASVEGRTIAEAELALGVGAGEGESDG